jgi:mannose-1-phosphate guanylyltransferase/mannose-6-phosphate isomerase
LVGTQTLFQQTLLRTRQFAGVVAAPIVVCNEAHRFLAAEQVRELGIEPQTLLLEPAGRNTAPAVGVAALLARQSAPAGTDPLLLVLPADHVILDEVAFARAVESAVEAAASGHLVAFGVEPSRPETGYGYILRGGDFGEWAAVERFVEKPDATTARRYVESGRYLWNSGMFLLGASTYLEELRVHVPAIARACERAVAAVTVDADFTRLGAEFLACPSDSIDYAVMEKTSRAAVVPLAAGWSDVGSWAALYDVLEKDSHGNVALGDVVIDGCTNSYFIGGGRTLAVIGLDGVAVVVTDDAVLVMAQDCSQRVKNVVDVLAARGA